MVITDYLVQDLPFTSAMLSAWGADPMTSFKPIAKNCYFIEFINKEDLDRALMGGPMQWQSSKYPLMLSLN